MASLPPISTLSSHLAGPPASCMAGASAERSLTAPCHAMPWSDTFPTLSWGESGASHSQTQHGSEPATQPNCPLFRLPAELRNEIYLLVAQDDGTGVLRCRDRDSFTSLDPLSLTCKYIRHEYLDVLFKKATTIVSRSFDSGFSNTFLLRHQMADPNEAPRRGRERKSKRGRRARGS